MATSVRSLTLNNISVAKYALQALPTVHCVAQYGTRHREFHENRIGRPATAISKLTRPLISPLSPLADNLWLHLNKVAMASCDPRTAHCLLALRRIEEID